MAKQVKSDPVEQQVTINGQFLREQAQEAVQQFFRPLTAPFERKNAKHNRPVNGRRAKA
jgi:hypothetical protein